MEDTVISIETATLLKELGFDIPVTYCYDKCDMLCSYNLSEKTNYNSSGFCYSAPTQSLTQKWLRKVHNIYVNVDILPQTVKDITSREYIENGCLTTLLYESDYHMFIEFEDALEKALFEAISVLLKRRSQDQK